ncbi:MAG: hypothetical protein AAGI38_11165, partial [Bacteroidota bacterium]
RKEFENLRPDGDYAKWDCQDFEGAYYLFEQITWLTLVYDTFSVEEYETLDYLLVDCLGAEYGEDFLGFREVIRFMKKDF